MRGWSASAGAADNVVVTAAAEHRLRHSEQLSGQRRSYTNPTEAFARPAQCIEIPHEQE